MPFNFNLTFFVFSSSESSTESSENTENSQSNELPLNDALVWHFLAWNQYSKKFRGSGRFSFREFLAKVTGFYSDKVSRQDLKVPATAEGMSKPQKR